MIKKNRKLLKILLICLAALIFAFVILGVWLGGGTLTQAKIKIFNTLPYPMALVDGSPIPMKDYLLRLEVSQKLTSSAAGREVKQKIYSQVINEAKTERLAAKAGIYISKREIQNEYDLRANLVDFKNQLNQSGLSEEQFKDKVVKPYLELVRLEAWHSSQESLNQKPYELAEKLLEQIQRGQDMKALAASTTEDSLGKATSGDLGFVDPATLLTELKEPVENMREGEIKLVSSRLGLHIIRHEGQNGSLRHLRQIFVRTNDFDQWLLEEYKKLKVWNFVKI